MWQAAVCSKRVGYPAHTRSTGTSRYTESPGKQTVVVVVSSGAIILGQLHDSVDGCVLPAPCGWYKRFDLMLQCLQLNCYPMHAETDISLQHITALRDLSLAVDWCEVPAAYLPV
jgi:hypothetical protein